MSERVLTDAEISNLMRDHLYAGLVYAASDKRPDLARAVEAAVLAKIAASRYCPKPAGYIPEREARKRERAAALAAVERAMMNSPAWESWFNVAYPLPTKTVPRTVTLSDGWTVLANAPVHVMREHATTAEDFRKIADLMERPTEEVPDE